MNSLVYCVPNPKSHMKTIAAVANNVLEHTKYILLAALLILVSFTIGTFLLRLFDVHAPLSLDVKHGVIPFFGAATASMLMTKRFSKKD